MVSASPMASLPLAWRLSCPSLSDRYCPCSLPGTARIAARHAAAGTLGSHLERRRRLAGPDLEFRACARQRLPASPAPQRERAWDAWQAGRYQRGEISQRPGSAGNPFRPR